MGKVTELNSLVCRSLDLSVGFQGGSLVKKLCANGNTRDEASIPGLERPPGGKKWQPTPVILTGKSHGQWPGSHSSWGHKESNTTEHTHTHTHTHRLGCTVSPTDAEDLHSSRCLICD